MHSLSNILKDSARNPAEWGVIRIIRRVGGEDVVNCCSESGPYLLRTIWQTYARYLLSICTCVRVYYIESGENVEFLERLFKRDLEDEIIHTIFIFVRAKEGETSMHRDKVAIRRNVAGKSGSKRSVRRSGQVMAKNAG